MNWLKSILIRRSTRYGANLFLFMVIVLGIVVFINYLSFKHHKRWDITKNKVHSLSDQTIKVLKNLESQVRVKAFYKEGENAQYEFKGLLNEYAYHSDKIKYEFIDPDRSPAITQNYGVDTYGTTIFEYADRTEKITESTEEAVTNALLKITRAEVKKVYFLEGHGEPDIDSDDKNGYETAKKALCNQTLQVDKLMLMRTPEVPEDCAAIVVAGPKKDLFDHEKETLRKYLDSGGSALFLVDPEPSVSLAEFLKDWGVKVGQDIVVDPMSRLFGGDYFMPVVSSYQAHEITRGFNIASFFPLARSISRADNVKSGLMVTELAKTSPGSWAETNIRNNTAEFNEGEDTQGPVALAVVVTAEVKSAEEEIKDNNAVSAESDFTQDLTKETPTPAPRRKKDSARIAVVGDSDFANNQLFGLSGNGDFFLNIVSWLAGEEKLISIRPKKPETNRINLSSKQATVIFWLSTVFFPVVLLITSGIVWWRRRRG